MFLQLDFSSNVCILQQNGLILQDLLVLLSHNITQEAGSVRKNHKTKSAHIVWSQACHDIPLWIKWVGWECSADRVEENNRRELGETPASVFVELLHNTSLYHWSVTIRVDVWASAKDMHGSYEARPQLKSAFPSGTAQEETQCPCKNEGICCGSAIVCHELWLWTTAATRNYLKVEGSCLLHGRARRWSSLLSTCWSCESCTDGCQCTCRSEWVFCDWVSNSKPWFYGDTKRTTGGSMVFLPSPSTSRAFRISGVTHDWRGRGVVTVNLWLCLHAVLYVLHLNTWLDCACYTLNAHVKSLKGFEPHPWVICTQHKSPSLDPC